MELVRTISVALFLCRSPFRSGDRLVNTTSRTITILTIEYAPIFVTVTRSKAICKAEPYITVNDNIIGVGAITIIGHFDTFTGIPALTQWLTAHKVHCRIGVQANESNQH